MISHMTSCIAACAVMLALNGCDDGPSNASSNAAEPVVTINMSGNDSGDVSVNIPGFTGKIRVPGEMMAEGKFDINGVSLFPGSKVSNVKIVSGDEPFTMTFDAPATPGKVATWFQERFAEKSVKASPTATGLSGTTKDGERFTIDLVPTDKGHSTGTIKVGSGKS